MPNPDSTRQYWQGYRNAKTTVYLLGIEAAEELEFSDKESQFVQGFAAGLAKLSSELIELIRKEKRK